MTKFNFLKDIPNDDILGHHNKIVETLYNLTESEEGGKCIALTGEWGSGKTTIIEELRKKIEKEKNKFLLFSFDLWQHEGKALSKMFLLKLKEFLDKINNNDIFNDDENCKEKWAALNNKIKKETIKQKNKFLYFNKFLVIIIYFITIVLNLEIKEFDTKIKPLLLLSISMFPILTVFIIDLFKTIKYLIIKIFYKINIVKIIIIKIIEKISAKVRRIIYYLFLIISILSIIFIWQAKLITLWQIITIISIYYIAFSLFEIISKKIKSDELFNFLQNKSTKVTEIKESFESPEPSSIEFEQLYECILNKSKHLFEKLIIVIDNIDRVDEITAMKVLTTLKPFIQIYGNNNNKNENTIYSKIWYIIPFDKERILKIWGNKKNDDNNNKENKDNKITIEKNEIKLAFLQKIFQFEIKTPILLFSEWKKFFEEKIKETNEKYFTNDKVEKIIEIFNIIYEENFKNEPTPRQIIYYINNLCLSIMNNEIIDYIYHAIYIGLRNYDENIFKKEYFDNEILKKYIKLKDIIKKDDKWFIKLASLYYGVDENIAPQIYYEKNIKEIIKDINKDEWEKIKGKPGAIDIALKVINEYGNTDIEKEPDKIGVMAYIFEKEEKIKKLLVNLLEKIKIIKELDEKAGIGFGILIENTDEQFINKFLDIIENIDINENLEKNILGICRAIERIKNKINRKLNFKKITGRAYIELLYILFLLKDNKKIGKELISIFICETHIKNMIDFIKTLIENNNELGNDYILTLEYLIKEFDQIKEEINNNLIDSIIKKFINHKYISILIYFYYQKKVMDFLVNNYSLFGYINNLINDKNDKNYNLLAKYIILKLLFSEKINYNPYNGNILNIEFWDNEVFKKSIIELLNYKDIKEKIFIAIKNNVNNIDYKVAKKVFNILAQNDENEFLNFIDKFLFNDYSVVKDFLNSFTNNPEELIAKHLKENEDNRKYFENNNLDYNNKNHIEFLNLLIKSSNNIEYIFEWVKNNIEKISENEWEDIIENKKDLLSLLNSITEKYNRKFDNNFLINLITSLEKINLYILEGKKNIEKNIVDLIFNFIDSTAINYLNEKIFEQYQNDENFKNNNSYYLLNLYGEKIINKNNLNDEKLKNFIDKIYDFKIDKISGENDLLFKELKLIIKLFKENNINLNKIKNKDFLEIIINKIENKKLQINNEDKKILLDEYLDFLKGGFNNEK
jgi:tRNA A37 threonylcarbamoyladenosine biosynthesis protein TsaE